MKRRQFLHTAVAAGAGLGLARHVHAFSRNAGRSAANALALHPFVAAHPEAVFIRRTQVADKLDTAAKFAAGAAFMGELFTAGESGEAPFANAFAIKPNLTCTMGTGNTPAGMGIMTDIPFVDGVMQGLRDQGFPGGNMFMREGNWLGDGYCAGEYPVTGPLLEALVQKHGCHVYDFPTGRRLTDMTLDTLQAGTEVIWCDVPDGVVFRRIGYVAPYNDDDTFLLNIAKFKAHSMGLTLAVKNLQGMAVSRYVSFCEGLDSTALQPASVLQDFNPDRRRLIDESHARHLAAGIPRWDRPDNGGIGGYAMETWAQRTCDSHSVIRAGLHVVEAIYGRNGNGFTEGPGPGNTPQEFMTNMLLFGKNAFLVDVIGHWLGGHEPGNFGLFHIALERGLCPTIIPDEIPLYDWNNGEPYPISLAEQPRTPILTPYLRKDYNGGSEEKYHLVDEPFDYSTVSARRLEPVADRPEIRALRNPVRDEALFEIRLPSESGVRVEMYNALGERVALLRDQRLAPGSHSIRWRPGRLAPGLYFAQLRTPSHIATAKVVLLR